MKPFIFIHIPKTAGISISRVIDSYAQRKLHIRNFDMPISSNKGINIGHISLFALLKSGNLRKGYYNKAFKFCFVRNPWDRAVSLFEFLNRRGIVNHNKFKNFLYELRDKGISPIGLMNVSDNSQCNQQVEWIINNKKCVADFVGRFEQLQRDFDKLCDLLGMPRKRLPKENVTRRKKYNHYYNTETRKLVGRLYDRDIDYFKYTF